MTKSVIFLSLPRSVYVWWKVLGLCPFVFDEAEIIRFSQGGCFYTIVLLLVYVVLYVRAILNRIEFVLPSETTMAIVADFIALSVDFFLIFASWLCAALRSNELRKILKRFESVHAIAESIGIGQNSGKLCRRLKIHVILVNFVWYSLFFADHVLLLENESFKQDVWMPFNLLRIVNCNVVIIFANALLVVQKYFYLVNRKIDGLSQGATTLRVLPRQRPNSSRHRGLRSYVMPGPLEVYGQMHSDLVTLTKRIANFFSLSIILVLLTHLIDMTLSLYNLSMMAKVQKRWIERDIFAYGLMCCWFLVHLTETVILLGIADSTTNEANQAGRLLHRMLTSANTNKYVDTGQLLSLRLLQRRLSISLWGLFQMKLSLVYTIIGAMATYITIMMQLDNENLHQDALNDSMLFNYTTMRLDE